MNLLTPVLNISPRRTISRFPGRTWRQNTKLQMWQACYRLSLQDRKQRKKERVDSDFKRFILAVRKTVRESHQNGVNSCLTTGAAAQQTVTDWQTLRRGWRCGHCATPSQLARSDKFCFSQPVGTKWRVLCHSHFWTPLRAHGKRKQEKGVLVFGELYFSPHVSQLCLQKTFSQR